MTVRHANRHRIRRTALITAIFLTVGPAIAAAQTIAFTNAHLIPVTGDEIERGTLIITNGKFAAIGPTDEITIPDGADVIDLAGKTIMPGLVDTHSHVGGIRGKGNDGDPVQPDRRILDSLNPRDSGFKRALAGGLTTLNIMPGSGHLNSGQTIYVKPRPAGTIDEMFIRDADGRPMGGMKMANGTNSLGNAPWPGTRAKSAAIMRQLFVDAATYRDKIAAAGDDISKRPARDLGKEALVEVLDGKRVVHYHTHRADDIATILRLKREFGFRVVLHHVSEGSLVADEIASANVPCSIIALDSPGGKLEAINLVFETGRKLDEAGVRIAYHTDDWITDSRYFLRMPAFGMRAGLRRQAALESVTLAGAKILDLADRIGSLEPGKDADFIVLTGDPFSIYTKVLETWIDGEKVFDRTDPNDRLYAVGGYGAGNEQEPYMCCYEHGYGETE